MNKINRTEAFLISLFFLIITALIVLLSVGANLHSKCLAKGFPSHEMDWKLNKYCIKRDEVKIYRELE